MVKNRKSKSPYFSILTASLNRCPTLKNTLESVAQQSFRNFEHIVIDGGSIDGTVKLLKKFQESNGLKWVSEPDRGISDALNKGMRLAKGQFIFVLQADDSFIDRYRLEMAYNYISRYFADIMSFPVILQEVAGAERTIKPIRLTWYNHFKFIFHHQGCFVQSKVFEKVGGYRECFEISMDYDLIYRALKKNASVSFGNFPIARMGGGGVSSSVLRRVIEDRQVQLFNEDDPLWRIAQIIFYTLYLPYKRLHTLTLKNHIKNFGIFL